MKYLFLMSHPGYVRNYESTVRLLASRGHSVVVRFNSIRKQKKDAIEDKLISLFARISSEYPEVSCDLQVPLPEREGVSRTLTILLRDTTDYARYLHSRYEKAIKLRERIRKRIPPPLALLFWLGVQIGGESAPKMLDKLLRAVERSIPPDPKISAAIKEFAPDAVIITPGVEFGSPQTDYIKSAVSLSIPCILCVHSWDNLTNKGLIKAEPDHVVVWNEFQRTEAAALHGIPPGHVTVTGAQCYDHWFERKPSLSRDDFFARIGANRRDVKYILYLCSSPFIAPSEVPFVRQLVRAMRSSPFPAVRDLAVLVRPHPQNAAQWKDVTFESAENAFVWPRGGSNPIDDTAKEEYFNSLFHCEAVVGVNTSAMVEASILNKAVFTVTSPEFLNTQEGTLHFRYLVNCGLLFTCADSEEFAGKLDKVMREGAEKRGERSRRFVTQFIRPRGIAEPCTPYIVQAIEAASIRQGNQ